MTLRAEFTADDRRALAATMKVALVATLDADGAPHLSLLTSLMAQDDKTLTIGEFCLGRSKENMRARPKVAFWVLDAARRVWSGQALWREARGEGPEYDRYNQQPLFRYNAYFGINTVHYLELVSLQGPQPLPLARLIGPSLLTKAAKPLLSRPALPHGERVMNPWTEAFARRLDLIKVAALAHEDGFPRLFPLFPAQANSDRSLVFSPFLGGEETQALGAGATLALFLLSTQLENVLLRGRFAGYSRQAGLRLGALEVDWVYNSMPPAHGQIYPPQRPQAVERF